MPTKTRPRSSNGCLYPDEPGLEGFADIIAARRRIAEETVAMAEAYRDIFWERLQARLKAHSTYQR